MLQGVNAVARPWTRRETPGEAYVGEWARRLRARLLSGLYVDLDRDYANSIFLAGSGRSGTTWVSDIINYRNEYRYIFEPFHPGKVAVCEHFRPRQYLRPGDAREEFLGPAQTILSGGLRSRWADRFHTRFFSRRRLIKDIRANLLLGWIRANFPKIPIVLLLRHPCAVASSELKLRWAPGLDVFLSQRELMADFLEPFREEIEGVRTDFERHVIAWCIENLVPLRQLGRGEVHLIFYESLCERPEEEVESLFAFLGKEFDRSVLRRMRRPSLLSREGSAVVSGERLVDGWRAHVSAGQIERTEELLGLFGLGGVYSADPMPDATGALALLEGGKGP
jgi:hypothetical protein